MGLFNKKSFRRAYSIKEAQEMLRKYPEYSLEEVGENQFRLMNPKEEKIKIQKIKEQRARNNEINCFEERRKGFLNEMNIQVNQNKSPIISIEEYKEEIRNENKGYERA